MSGGSLEPQCLVCRPVLSMRIPVLAAAMVTASHLVAWPKTTKTKTQDVLWATERGRGEPFARRKANHFIQQMMVS